MLDSNFWKSVWFIPSFYGFVFWNIALAAYLLRYIHWDETSELALFVFLSVSCAQFLSTLLHAPAYGRWYESRLRRNEPLPDFEQWRLLILSLHLVGFVGLMLYWQQLITTFGSWRAVLLLLATESYQIRQATEEIATVGIQLTYLGWLAIALSAVFIVRRGWSFTWATLSLCQLAGNLLFVDRTRPVWILICAALVAMAIDRGQISRRPWLPMGAIAAIAAALFILIGSWVGKVGGEAGGYGATSLEGFSFSIYLYMTGGFAYANELLSHALATEWIPHRVLYPIFKGLSSIGLASTPPSQIAEFLYIPYPTNVGTFLEPFIKDGGLGFAALGILVYTLIFDNIALVCLRSNKLLPAFFWAQLCFASMIGFFTPKINSTPFWMFLLLTACILVGMYVRSALNRLGSYRHSSNPTV